MPMRRITITSICAAMALTVSMMTSAAAQQVPAPDSQTESDTRGSDHGADGARSPSQPRSKGDGEAARPANPEAPKGCPYRERDLNLLV